MYEISIPVHCDRLPLTVAQPAIGMRGAACWKGVCVGSLQVRTGLPKRTMRFALCLHPGPDLGLSRAVYDAQGCWAVWLISRKQQQKKAIGKISCSKQECVAMADIK